MLQRAKGDGPERLPSRMAPISSPVLEMSFPFEPMETKLYGRTATPPFYQRPLASSY